MATDDKAPVQSGGSGGAIFVFLAVIVAALVVASSAGVFNGLGDGGATSSAGTSASSGIGAKFIKEAKKHDDEAYVYGSGHPISSYRKGGGLDCSSLINVVVFKVTGVREDLTARDFRNSSHWRKVKTRDVKAGDIMYILKDNHPERSDDHVVFVVKNGGHPTVFEAYSGRPGIPFKDQIRQSSNRARSEYDGALRWRK